MHWRPRALKARYNKISAIDRRLPEFAIDTIKENMTCLDVMGCEGRVRHWSVCITAMIKESRYGLHWLSKYY